MKRLWTSLLLLISPKLKEDFLLSKIAKALDKKHAKTMNHREAWKKQKTSRK